MAWNSLGTVYPELLEWRDFASALSLEPLFKASQSWAGDWPGSGSIDFAVQYVGAGRYGYERLYIDQADKVLILQPNSILLAAGFTSRRLLCRLNSRARLLSAANLSVQAYQWMPEA